MGRYELTVAMAAYDDFNGIFFSTQALRMYQDMRNVEIIVLDNNPDSAEGHTTKSYVESIQHNESIRYVPFKGSIGTTQTREHLFQLAEGDAVLVMDCHVLLQANAIYNLKKFYREASEQQRKDLYTGPLLMDGLNFVMTHFECEWREQMWGVWAAAWKSPTGDAVIFQEHEGKTQSRLLNTSGPWKTLDIPWAGHESILMEQGYKVMGMDSTDAPFEIPAQGLGLFSSTKEHWLGFNPDFRSFGGEECYIHEKYRQHGRKAMCLPFLKWNHRFGRPGGPKYPITVEGKMRNYIIGFKELGLDLEPVRHHFVDEVGVSASTWEYALQDPVAYTPGKAYGQEPIAPSLPSAKSNLGLPLPVVADSFKSVSTFLQTAAQRDLDQHAPALESLASRCNSVIEVTKRRESSAFLLAGLTSKSACEQKKCESEGCSGACNRTVKMHTFQEEEDSLHLLLEELAASGIGGDKQIEWTNQVGSIEEMPELPFEPDMLFLDTRHTGERASAELAKYGPSVKKYIVYHDTASHGQYGEDGKPGLMFAIRDFLHANPDWFVYWHTNEQYGLTVLSREVADKPAKQLKPWPPMDKAGNRCGCGQSLKASLKMIGIEASEGCSCNAMAAQMDDWGPDLCREKLNEILDWLKSQAEARNMGHLFIRPAVKLMVLRAIKHAEKQAKAGECY